MSTAIFFDWLFLKIIFFIIALYILNVYICIGQISYIDLNHSFEKKGLIDLSEIAYSVEYVKLETNPNCRVGPQVRVYCNEKYIVTISINNIFVFDRKTGAFITEIGRSDQIHSTYYILPFDEQRSLITFKSSSNTIAEYSLMNNFIREIKLPAEHGNSVYWKNGKYIQFVANMSGYDIRRLIVFTEDNTILKVHPNKKRFVKTIKANFYSNKEGGFYWFNSNLYFKETFIDTIYQVTKEKLIPKYCFNTGYRGLDYSMKGTMDLINKQKYFFISNIFETEKYLFFNVEYGLRIYSGIYFKKEEKCKISDYCLTNRTGFKNDIDHFIPMYFSSVNKSNELVGFCIPGEIKKWKKETTVKISDNESLRVLEVHEDDNPIVIIAKLK